MGVVFDVSLQVDFKISQLAISCLKVNQLDIYCEVSNLIISITPLYPPHPSLSHPLALPISPHPLTLTRPFPLPPSLPTLRSTHPSPSLPTPSLSTSLIHLCRSTNLSRASSTSLKQGNSKSAVETSFIANVIYIYVNIL